jgi:glyoxylase-like metal-dependent hydrolase (beta-lactamase superfamily II)
MSGRPPLETHPYQILGEKSEGDWRRRGEWIVACVSCRFPTGVFMRASRKAFLILALGLGASASAFARDGGASAILERAIAAAGGDAALESVRQLRIVYVGTQDAGAVYQGVSAERPTPERRFETLVLDVPSRSGALRTEGVWSDGSPALWRTTLLGDAGYLLNVKTGRANPMSPEKARAWWERWTFSVPALALRELRMRRGELGVIGELERGGMRFDALSLPLAGRPTLSVLFDRAGGRLAGYEYEAPLLGVPTRFGYRFRGDGSRRAGAGMPDSVTQLVGDRVYRDLAVFDARESKVSGDPWLAPLPAGTEPISRVASQEPRAETIAPGVRLLRNVGGYNALIAEVGECVAVVDAPATFAVEWPTPPDAPPKDLGALVRDAASREVPGKRICWVVPTHHHGDHFGGIASPAFDGAAVITTSGNAELARRVLARARPGREPRVEVLDRVRTLGDGESRIELHPLAGTMHADEMVFAYLPGRRIAFEGDVGDYVLACKAFLRYLEEKKLAVDRVYSVHGSSSWTLPDAETDDPGN